MFQTLLFIQSQYSLKPENYYWSDQFSDVLVRLRDSLRMLQLHTLVLNHVAVDAVICASNRRHCSCISLSSSLPDSSKSRSSMQVLVSWSNPGGTTTLCFVGVGLITICLFLWSSPLTPFRVLAQIARASFHAVDRSDIESAHLFFCFPRCPIVRCCPPF